MRDLADDLHAHVRALFPIWRSITGPGLRETLRYIGEWLPLRIHEVPSGTPVLDWEVPPEWTVRGGTIRTLDGRTVIDTAEHNLHLLQYSVPIDRVVGREELDRHLHSLPDQPDLIPYRTSYYVRNWGFCVTERQRAAMQDAAYRVTIDATLAPGSLSYGECLLRGETEEEVLLSTHCCHPALANDNCAAIAVAIELARALADQPRRLTYRFLFAPGTIGAIAWLHGNRAVLPRIRHGLVLSCLGDPGPPSYKQSRRGTARIDRYAAQALREAGHADRVLPFVPYGYDERQYCSPGFDLPVGCLMRSPNGTFPEYHTSADDPDFVRPEALRDSLSMLQGIVGMIEQDGVWRSTSPYGEPQLGRRGLYGASGLDQMALLWVLNLADGRHSLLDIAERSGQGFAAIAAAAAAATRLGLLVAEPEPPA